MQRPNNGGKLTMEEKNYSKPVIISENLFDVEAGGLSLFARCWCINDGAGWDGSYSTWPNGKTENVS